MTPHQERVVVEKKELDAKLLALAQFISGNPIFQTLPEGEKFLLRSQREIMTEYSDVLAARIARWSK